MPDEGKEAQSLVSGLLRSIEGVEDSKGSSLPVAVFLMGLVVLAISYFGWQLVRARRRSAKLARDLRKAQESQRQAAEDHKLANNNAARNVAHKKVKRLEAGITELKKKIGVSNAAQQKQAKALADVTRWDDLVVVDKRGE